MFKSSLLKKIFIFCITVTSLFSCISGKASDTILNKSSNTEIIYHVFERSFYDSNGDHIGDLNGLKEKLGYLQDLGVTSILLLPLYKSVYYHNYYSSDFYKIDSTLGTMKDYISLVKEIHRRGMKIYMDMETQYVTEDHPWYKSAINNPKSPYSNYILFEDSAHTRPATFVFGLRGWTGYNGVYKKIVTVNLKNKEVLDYNIRLFKHWVDPNNDGKFDDGVDGFRFDHMMDDLDNKPQLKNLFQSFWLPLITALKKINPNLKDVAEVANWNSWGRKYISSGVTDRVFSFKLMGAIRSFNKNYLSRMTDSAYKFFPDGDRQIVFIENHDLPRFSDGVHHSLPKLKIGAALNLLLGWIPSIYYGQEIGMESSSASAKWGLNDGNDIPKREAFEWYKSDTGKGMAIWYKNTGPWWDSTNLKPNDGISLEEEKPDPNSIYNFYKKMISIRKNNPVISTGKYENLDNTNNSVFSYQRYDPENTIIVVINLSAIDQNAEVMYPGYDPKKKDIKILNGNVAPLVFGKDFQIKLPPYGIEVFQLTRK